MASTQLTTRSEGAMSTAGYENYRRLMNQEEEDEEEYVPRCCCCESMNFVRFFGIYSTFLALLALRIKLGIAYEQALLIQDFSSLLFDQMKAHSTVLAFCTLSMIFVACAFRFKLGKLLYGPILLHASLFIVGLLQSVAAVDLIFYHWMQNDLAKIIFANRLDDLAFDHPDRKYEELYAYNMNAIQKDVFVFGSMHAFQVPLHIAFIVVCWRLRGHLEQKKAMQQAREEREEMEAKKKEKTK